MEVLSNKLKIQLVLQSCNSNKVQNYDKKKICMYSHDTVIFLNVSDSRICKNNDKIHTNVSRFAQKFVTKPWNGNIRTSAEGSKGNTFT